MVNWNSRYIRKGRMVDGNFIVDKVTESRGVRTFHLRMVNLPDGFEASIVKVKAPASSQDLTLREANEE